MRLDKSKMNSIDDIVIIGSGIAGMTCGLYLGRANRRFTIIGDWANSSLASSPMVKNYPGAGDVDGATILNNLHEQMMSNGNPIEITEDCVSLHADEDGSMAVVETEHNVISANKIVIATGRRPRLLGLNGENELIGNGISTCAYCDGNLYEGRKIAIVGGGNSAVDEAIYLSSIVEHIDLIVRKDILRSDKIQTEKLMRKDNVSVCFNTEFRSLKRLNDGRIYTVDNNQVERAYNGIFYAIGSVPNTDFIHLDSFSNLSRENMYDGYVPRMFSDRSIIIFSAGDVSYRESKRFQAIIAAAEGAETALEII